MTGTSSPTPASRSGFDAARLAVESFCYDLDLGHHQLRSPSELDTPTNWSRGRPPFLLPSGESVVYCPALTHALNLRHRSVRLAVEVDYRIEADDKSQSLTRHVGLPKQDVPEGYPGRISVVGSKGVDEGTPLDLH